MNNNEKWMGQALLEAQKTIDEVPIGAIIVKDNQIIGRGYNLKEKSNDATAHAEMIAIRKASQFIGNWRLEGCTMYVTLEPCAMCIGAIIESRISRLVFGAKESRMGCTVSNVNLPEVLSHIGSLLVIGGVLESQCLSLLQDFFKAKRKL